MSGFSDEPRDPIQEAGAAGLEVIAATLARAGIDVDDYGVVVTINRGDDVVTCLHMPGDVPDQLRGQAAFDMQLLHLAATGRELGVRVVPVPIELGHG